jgi:calcium-dependent protein kinase
MLYILLSGLPPFWGDDEESIFRMVLKADIDFQTPPWPSVSSAAKDCVRQLLNVKPDKRPTASQLLQVYPPAAS